MYLYTFLHVVHCVLDAARDNVPYNCPLLLLFYIHGDLVLVTNLPVTVVHALLEILSSMAAAQLHSPAFLEPVKSVLQ